MYKIYNISFIIIKKSNKDKILKIFYILLMIFHYSYQNLNK
jgi:hypothetical protein